MADVVSCDLCQAHDELTLATIEFVHTTEA